LVTIRLAEQLSTQFFDRLHDQRTIEEIILLLATRFGGQDAAMAGRSMKVTIFLPALRIMLRADRIVRAQQPEFQRASHRIVNPTPDLDQVSERSFGIRTPGIEQDSVADAWNRIDPLLDRT
jgi:hypothetical protein